MTSAASHYWGEKRGGEAYRIVLDIDNSISFDGIVLDGWQADVDADLRNGNSDAAISTAQTKLAEAIASSDKSGEAMAAVTLAQTFLWADKTQEALLHAEQAQLLFNSVGDVLDQAVAKHTLARVRLLRKEYEDAFEAATDALALFKKAVHKSAEAAVLNTLATCELMRGNGDESLNRVEASLDLFRETGKMAGQVAAMHTKAILFSAAGEKAEGVRLSQEAASLMKDSGDDRRYIGTLLGVSESALQAGDLCLSIDSCLDAIVVLEKLDDQRGQVGVLLTLCGLYFKQEMFVAGIDTAQNVISTCQSIGDKKCEAQAWFVTAQLKRAKSATGGLEWPPKQGLPPKDLEEMQTAAERAVMLFEEIGDDDGEAGARFELCHSFLAKGDIARGRKEIATSQKKFQQAADNTGECIATIIMGQVQFAGDEKDVALSSIQKALDMAKELAQPFLERVCKEWINKISPPQKEKDSEAPAPPGDALHDERGGISSNTYAACMHRSLLYGESDGEHFFDNPVQANLLEQMIGVKFPFFRNRPAPGKEWDMEASVAAWQNPPAKPIVKVVAGAKTAGGGAAVPDKTIDLKKPRLPPMAVPPPKIQEATARAEGNDLLGGRLPEVPEEVHTDMVELASRGDIPVTKPQDRAVYMTRRPSFYGDPVFRDALRFGYIHPTAACGPRGMKWKSVRAGAYKLISV